MKKKTLVISLLIFCLFLVISSAFIISNINYNIMGTITSGGSVGLTNPTAQYLAKVAVGQAMVGTASAGGYKVCFGIFCTGTFEPQYNINFTGLLNYSNGSAVRYAPVKIIVGYPAEAPTLQYEGNNRTDANGFFFVKIKNLPEILFVPPKILRVDIYVVGEVEAKYFCFYNYTNDQKCCPIYGIPC